MGTEDTDVEAGPCLSEHQAGARAITMHVVNSLDGSQSMWWVQKNGLNKLAIVQIQFSFL